MPAWQTSPADLMIFDSYSPLTPAVTGIFDSVDRPVKLASSCKTSSFNLRH